MSKTQELGARATKTLWWAASINRYRDQTGIAHVVHGGAALCGARPFGMGGSYASAEATGCQECRRCRHIVNKAGERNAS